MTKEQELMAYLHERVFDPILASVTAPARLKKGVRITIARMSKLRAAQMVQYFWSALAADNAIEFSKHLKEDGRTRFEDVMEDFRDRFNDAWIARP